MEEGNRKQMINRKQMQNETVNKCKMKPSTNAK